jgi:aminoglycoside phosphotransferase (APT) family kinase protein
VRLHPDQVPVEVGLVERLVAAQLPQLAHLPITPVRSTGTVNALYRLGEHLRAGRLAAVIDFGAAGVGDPATDVIAAWSVFGPAGRAAYRGALDVDGGTWARARGIALHQAALIIPYYRETNPGFVALARRTVTQLLIDEC